MKIGVDARLLSQRVTGIGRYTNDLSLALLRQADKRGDKYLLYTPSPPVGSTSNLIRKNVRAWGVRGRLARMLWSQSLLPLAATRDGIDLFWGATHRLPRYLPDRIARVVTIHDLVWRRAGDTMRPLSRWMESRLMPEAIRLADRIMVDSRSTFNDLSSEFPQAAEKIRIVHLGITSLVAPSARSDLSEMGIFKPYFLFVGTLEPRKNLRRLLSAYASLPEFVRDAYSLVIAGGKGWGCIDLNAVIRSLGLEGSVILVGYVSDSQLTSLYSNARFLAMPSIYEGFGLPLLEAMSLGIPVLTSNCSSLPEVVGNAGLLVDPLDDLALAKGLLNLLMDDVLHANLASKTLPNAKRFSWDKCAAETIAVFDEAIALRDNRMSRSR